MFSFLYHEIFYRPLFNALIFFTDILPGASLGASIIIVTLLVRLLLFPFQHKMIKTQSTIKSIEPEMRRIKEQYKNKKEEQARAVMELYRRHGISPFSGILLLIIQLPLLIALYRIFMNGFGGDLSVALYSFVSFPEHMNSIFLGINLAEASATLAALAGISQFFQMRFSMARMGADTQQDKKNKSIGAEFQRAMKTQAQYIFPFVIFFIGLKFSAALTLYWTVMNIFAIVHEGVVRRGARTLKHGN